MLLFFLPLTSKIRLLGKRTGNFLLLAVFLVQLG